MENFVCQKKNFKCYTMVYGKPMKKTQYWGYVLRFSRESNKPCKQNFVFFEVEVGMNEEGQNNLNYNNQGGRIRSHGLIWQLWVGQVVS